MKYAVKAKAIFDGSAEKPRLEQALVFEDGMITDIVPFAALPGMEGPDFQVIDHSNCYLTPGLIDAHVHLMLQGDGTAGDDTARLAHGEISILAARNAMTALQSGITTVRDCGGLPDVVFPLRSAIDKGFIPGPDLILCGVPLTPIGGHCHYMGGEVSGPEDVRLKARTNFKNGANFVKMMATGGGTKNILPNGDMLSLEEMKVGVEEAHRWHAKACAHVLTNSGFSTVLAAGIDCIEHGAFSAYDGSFEFLPEAAREIADRGIVICSTIQVLTNKIRSYAEAPRRSAQEDAEYDRLRRTEEVYKKSVEKTCGSVRYMLGSDAGWRQSGFGELYLGMQMMADCGMKNLDVIQSATGTPADFFGMGDRVGHLKPGAQADFLVLEGDPEEDLAAFQNPLQVYKKGSLVDVRI